MDERHFKERTPKETISILKEILKRNNITLKEIWSEKSTVDTYSLRLVIEGTDIGTNGKGISKELATASAYAEFFERFQNRALADFKFQKCHDFFVTKDEVIKNGEELICDNTEFINQYMNMIGLGDESIQNKIKWLETREIRDRLEYGLDKEYVTLPYFNAYNNSVEYLPYSICKMLYSSNGMCAGNSIEEALVQGISEIIERYVQKRLILEAPTLPDIPENYLKKFPYVYDRFRKMREIKGYDFYFKDCSFCGKYSVAALVIIKKGTGSYGLKIGCHPNYGIAMERAITESTQGQDIIGFCNRSHLDFNNHNVTNEKNIINSFKAGIAQYPYQIIGKNPSYEFVEMPDMEWADNKNLLQLYVEKIKTAGYTIYIRNESKLGFTSLQVIIPRISEVITPNENIIKAYNTRLYLNKFLKEPQSIKKKECNYFISTIKFFSGLILEDSISSRYADRYDCSNIPGDNIQSSSEYFALLCYVYLGKYQEAAKMCKRLINNAKIFRADSRQSTYYNALYYYLTARYNSESHKSALEYLKIYFDDDVCMEIDEDYKENKEIIRKIYPSLEEIPEKYKISDRNYKSINNLYESLCEIVINQISLKEIIH